MAASPSLANMIFHLLNFFTLSIFEIFLQLAFCSKNIHLVFLLPFTTFQILLRLGVTPLGMFHISALNWSWWWGIRDCQILGWDDKLVSARRQIGGSLHSDAPRLEEFHPSQLQFIPPNTAFATILAPKDLLSNYPIIQLLEYQIPPPRSSQKLPMRERYHRSVGVKMTGKNARMVQKKLGAHYFTKHEISAIEKNWRTIPLKAQYPGPVVPLATRCGQIFEFPIFKLLSLWAVTFSAIFTFDQRKA